MEQYKQAIIFSENRETKGMFQSLGLFGDMQTLIVNKSEVTLNQLSNKKYDLIIVDILHPVMTEIEFVERVHSNAHNTPIIVLSGYFYDTKDIVFGDKIAEFLLKPVTIEKLLGAVQKIFKPARFPVLQKNAPVEDIHYESKKLSVLLEISRSLTSKTNLNDLLSQIVTLATDGLNAERSTLFIVDSKRQELWSKTGIGIQTKEIRFPLNEGIAGEVALSGISQIVDNPYSHPKFNKEIDKKTGFVTRNILCVPMKNLSRKVIGVFQILNKKNKNFTKQDEIFLSAMASSTGIAIENALLIEERNSKVNQLNKSFDDVYIAQKQMVKEAKLSAYSELSGYFNHEVIDKDEILHLLSILKNVRKGDSELQNVADKVIKNYEDRINKFIDFINNKKRQYSL